MKKFQVLFFIIFVLMTGILMGSTHVTIKTSRMAIPVKSNSLSKKDKEKNLKKGNGFQIPTEFVPDWPSTFGIDDFVQKHMGLRLEGNEKEYKLAVNQMRETRSLPDSPKVSDLIAKENASLNWILARDAQIMKRSFDATKASELFARVKAAYNYNSIPPHYRALIEANKANLCPGRVDTVYAYFGKNFALRVEPVGQQDVIRIHHFYIDASNLMARFEPEKTAPKFYTISKNELKKMSVSDRAYVEALLDVVNENVSFLFDVPFFIPDMEMLKRNEYGGKFVPEKYLIVGDKLDFVPSHLITPSKLDIQRRWGFPIYDVSQVEIYGFNPLRNCFGSVDNYATNGWGQDIPDKPVSLRTKVVDRLYFFRFDTMQFLKDKRTSLFYVSTKQTLRSIFLIRKIQYTRALKSLDILERAMLNEEAYLKKTRQWTGCKRRVLNLLKKELSQILLPAKRLLKDAIEENQEAYDELCSIREKNKAKWQKANDVFEKELFIYTLRQPEGRPRSELRHPNVLKPAPFTSGKLELKAEGVDDISR